MVDEQVVKIGFRISWHRDIGSVWFGFCHLAFHKFVFITLVKCGFLYKRNIYKVESLIINELSV